MTLGKSGLTMQALKNEHEHRLSDEVIEESIEANEYQFDVDGELL